MVPPVLVVVVVVVVIVVGPAASLRAGSIFIGR